MGKLIRSELRKILWHPWVLLVLIGALVASNYQLIQLYSFAPEYYKYGKEFYAAYGGTLTPEKYEGIKALRKVQREGMSVSYESMWSSTALADIEYLVSFSDNREELLAVARDNVTVYEEAGLLYEQRLNAYICTRYGEKPGVQLVDINDWESYFEWNTFLQVPMLVIVLLLASIFTNERESGCYAVLAASVSGRKGMFRSKIIAGCIVSFGTMLLFVAADTLVAVYTKPLTNWDAPIQSIALFERCPYMITIGQAARIRALLLCVLGMVHGLFVCLISSLFARNISSMIAGAFWYLVSYFWYPLITYNGVTLGISVENKRLTDFLNLLRVFFYPMLAEPQYYLTKVSTVNLFGCPVPMLWTCLGVAVAACIICSIWAYGRYMKDDLSRGREGKRGIRA